MPMGDTIVSIPSDSDFSKVRLLVVGDTGVGKSCFVHKLCHGNVLKNPRWTVGCNVEVMLHHYASSANNFFVEVWDLGGHPKYKHSRDIFYSQINGILLCFDMTNQVSYSNLRKWIREILIVDREKGVEEKYMYSSGGTGESSSSSAAASSFNNSSYHHRQQQAQDSSHSSSSSNHKSSTIGSLPVLIIGNKSDAVRDTRTFDCMKDFGLELAVVSSTDESSLHNNPVIANFLDTVIQRRYYRNHHSNTNNSNNNNSSNANLTSSTMPLASSSSSSSFGGLDRHTLVSTKRSPQLRHMSPNDKRSVSGFLLNASHSGSHNDMANSYAKSAPPVPSFDGSIPSYASSSSSSIPLQTDVIDISQLSSLTPSKSPRHTASSPYHHRASTSTWLSPQQTVAIRDAFTKRDKRT